MKMKSGRPLFDPSKSMTLSLRAAKQRSNLLVAWGLLRRSLPLAPRNDSRKLKFALSMFLLGLAITLGSARPAQGQAGGEVTETRVEHRFGEEVQFFARIQSPVAVQSASVTIRPVGGLAQTLAMSVNADGTAVYRLDARLNPLPAFARIVYWFDVALADGTRFASAQQEFIYSDNRFGWLALDSQNVRVHWYEGDAAFGAAALDAATRGIEKVQEFVPVEPSAPFDIYIYASAADLQSAIDFGGKSWFAGHASPEHGVAMILVFPDVRYELDRQIPHELAHLLLYQSLGPSYYNLPVWLREGLASNAENYANPDFDVTLTAAVDANTLLPLSGLCASFPPDTGSAFLAYAQAKSFVRFLIDRFGTTGLSALISAYADGMDCEQGANRALEQPLSQLEVVWRESALGENRSGVALANLLPYFIVLGLAMFIPLWGLAARMLERRKHVRRD